MTRAMFVVSLLFVAVLAVPRPAAAQGTDEVVYYHTDAVGSVRMITDANGQVLANYDYLPFGEPWGTPAVSNPRQFAGTEQDQETILNYVGARYYQSQSGRFTRPDDPGYADPFDPQSMNLYAYAYNNPLKFIDPTGHQGDCAGQYNERNNTCEPWDLGLDQFLWWSWERAQESLKTVADVVQQFVTAPRSGPCMANWVGAGAMRGLAVGTALGAASGGFGIVVTAPGAVAVNVAGGAAVGSVACMGSASGGGGGGGQAGSGQGGFWKQLKPFRGQTKTNGQSGGARRFYERDRTHGDIEVYDARGRHLGSANPETGAITKPPIPGRRIGI